MTESWEDLNRNLLDSLKLEYEGEYEDCEFGFYATNLPGSRKADYYLSYLDGCLFMDFDKDEQGKIYLIRISFDGHGCCHLANGEKKTLDSSESIEFIDLILKSEIDNTKMYQLVKRLIDLNRDEIWQDALEEYSL